MESLNTKVWNAIIDISPVQFGVYDLEQHLQIYSSGLAEKVSGYTFDELQKFSKDFYQELILKEDFPQFENNLIRLLQSDKDLVVESIYRVRDKHGDLIWVRSNHRVLERDEQGQPIKLIASSEDITELKELEQRLETEVGKLQAIPSENLEELQVQLNAVSNIMCQFRENHFSSEMDRRLWNYMYHSVQKMDQVIGKVFQK
jgi:PAS domain S-box-containing protein